MQSYYFYLHTNHKTNIYVQKQPIEGLEPEFIWIDCTRDDVLNRAEQWQQEIFQYSQLSLNEYHVRDILNIEHPCAFDTLDDYDLLIFRKLITPEDRIATGQQVGEKHERIFGLATTPMSFIMTPQILITCAGTGQ